MSKAKNLIVQLLRSQLSNTIANNRLPVDFTDAVFTQIDKRYYADSASQGISLTANEDRKIVAIQLYSEGYEQHAQFRGSIPNGIAFDMTKDDIRALLGNPAASGGGGTIPVLGKVKRWDRFEYPDHCLHLLYSDTDDKVQLISIIDPSSTPK
jgi:hypothetical protein